MKTCPKEEILQAYLDGELAMEAIETVRAHLAACSHCAAAVQEIEQAFAVMSSAFAVELPDAAPTARLRARIESALAERAAPKLSWVQLFWRFGGVAAAVLLIAGGLLVYRTRQNESHQDNGGITEKTPATHSSVKREEQVANESVAPKPRRGWRAPQPRRSNRPRPTATIVPEIVIADDKDSADVTDFILLRYGDDHKPMESGQVIRVQMPRSALITLGLPVNVEHADVPVKADLLVGEDGLARAIRFVR